VQELRDELAKRGLDVNGLKQDLQSRLQVRPSVFFQLVKALYLRPLSFRSRACLHLLGGSG
jgi:hypothetical protein